ncbi:pyruvate kinase [Oceanobacillus profundus]|uniref:Pyruvate kinase n=1 Tax=Oceanobacillus profundus TaxID=372463 RepID=A0A417YIX9_9BACI|nr:pyruvate kinase [Oceanobacillus profundus]MBR3119546.1 pyruvate kinase [Oceanobacillus sp.]PAE30859.1 pyruvate kinase [Paenibacillus sp. 7884-2]MCM3398468.1 pyruvate kinase [Oceanobacillus profundus]MDO6448371.1 pyruvate kinase [Oceanobacillus profundus]RHW32942.1 pyruvate kinase [Oceanobacillus profundus]
MRNTKIVCTIGPASESIETLERLIDAGMNVARLNFSHGDFQEHGARIKNIREAAENKNKTVAILLDTKGPEIRTGNFKDGFADLVQGNTVVISMLEVEGTAERFSVTYDGLVHDVHPGSKILLDDGLIELEVIEVNASAGEIVTKALNSGVIKNKKGVNVPNVSVNLPGITDKDTADILFGIEQDVDFIAASFVRRASDVLEIKEVLEKNNGSHIQIIPKIENQEGVDNIDSILEVSEGLMVARGDLGVEIPAEDVPLVQKELIKKCNNAGKPVITATQMLDSMQRNPRPTRAEASDVANAIFDGTDAIMLSGETAAGAYPVESVQTMSNIALKAESALEHKSILNERSKNVDMTITEAISQSVTHTAMNLDVDTIITPTESGHTARMISKYRPKASILAVTFAAHVTRQLSLVWGVHPVIGKQTNTTDEMLDVAIDKALSTNMCKRGGRVIITAGVPVGESGTTNLLKVHVIGDVIARGQGIGKRTAYGRVVFAKSNEEALTKVEEGDILVTYGTEREMMPAIEKAAAIITEEGGLTSHAAVVGLSLGIPVIVGVKDVFTALEEGSDITVDGAKGDIYKGHASVL